VNELTGRPTGKFGQDFKIIGVDKDSTCKIIKNNSDK
jgi:hypothetical protein